MTTPPSAHLAALPPPDVDAALATAGMMIHWLQRDLRALRRFAVYTEYHPGDLTRDLPWLRDYLWECHEILNAGCEDPRGDAEDGDGLRVPR